MKSKIISKGFWGFISLIILLLYSTPAYPLPILLSWHSPTGGPVRVVISYKDRPNYIYEIFPPACENFKVTIPRDATDAGIFEAGPPIASTLLGVIEGTPGDLSLSNLGDGLFSLIGFEEFLVPALSTENNDLFVGINLTEWLNDPRPFNEGDVFTFVDGKSMSLPGFVVGTSETTFSSLEGWSTANPYKGIAVTHATIDGAAVPEPCTMLLLGTGLAGIAGFRKKFRKS